MKNKTLFFVLLILVNITSLAQKTINDPALENKLFRPYDNYFNKDCEWVYTHFNKSTYITGDDIWFTSYILNPENEQLNFSTSKLYIELWSPEKKLISRKILFVEDGTTSHFIHLADSLIPGIYCFRTYTNWMRNFYQENDFNTIITILSHDKVLDNEPKIERNKFFDITAQKRKTPELTTKLDYDIQFLPESGHFLEGADNVLGIKATDSYGRGVNIKGNILNVENQEIMSFTTNDLGMGNITIPETSSQPYIAKVTLPDSTIRDIQLPKAEPKGVIIHVSPCRPNVVWFRIQTNEATRQLKKSYNVMIHENGKIFNNYQIDFSKESVIQIRINKKELGGGILYVTIFDENLSLIAERLFYNQDDTKRGTLAFNPEILINDTVNLKIVVLDSLIKPQFTKLSISVLPNETVLNHFNNSLLAESILHPSLKGNIENPNWYFEKTDINHLVAIDNLLLTQGWRKYDWPTILKDTLHKFKYTFEEEFSINGKVKNWLNKPELKSKIILFSPQNNIFSWVPVDSIGTFKFDRVYLSDSTWIIASASKDNGKSQNRNIQLSIPESNLGVPELKQILTPPYKKDEIVGDIPKLTKGVIQLKEVVIKATKKRPFEDDINVSSISRILELTKNNYRDYGSMETLLRSYFNVKTQRIQYGTFHFDMGRGPISLGKSPISASVNKGPGSIPINTGAIHSANEPLMTINGVKIQDPEDILNIPLYLIEAIAVNKSVSMEGSHGTIAIKTRAIPLFEDNYQAPNIKQFIIKGYAAPKQYFEPKYIIQPGTADYDKYATIYWEPNLVIDSTGIASFKFAVPKEIKSVAIRAEGISSEGIIFLHEQKIILSRRN